MAVELDLTFHGDPAGIVDVARAIEERSASSTLYVPEGNHDAFVYLTLAAANTERLRLGTSIALAFARSARHRSEAQPLLGLEGFVLDFDLKQGDAPLLHFSRGLRSCAAPRPKVL